MPDVDAVINHIVQPLTIKIKQARLAPVEDASSASRFKQKEQQELRGKHLEEHQAQKQQQGQDWSWTNSSCSAQKTNTAEIWESP